MKLTSPLDFRNAAAGQIGHHDPKTKLLMSLLGISCVMVFGLLYPVQGLAWDDVGGGWYAEKLPRKGHPGTAMIHLKHENYLFMVEYDCRNRVLLTYDLAYVGLPVPKNKSAAAMFDYACQE